MRFAMKLSSLLGAGFLLSTVTFNVNANARAALITTDVEVEIVEGDLFLGESFFGTLVYDDSFLTGSGFELLALDSGLESFEFTYVGADLATPFTYTAADEIDFPDFPQLGFTDGELSGLIDGLLYETEISPDASFFFDGQFFGTDEFVTGSFNDGAVTYTTASVPEPVAIAGLAAIALLGMNNRRRHYS